MPRDSSGNVTLYTPGNPVVTGTTIASAWGNNTLNDIANILTNSLDRSGNGGMLGQLKILDGTAGAPGLTFAGEPSTGIYRVSANQVGFSVGGAARFVLNTTSLIGSLGMNITLAPGAGVNGITITTASGTAAIQAAGPAATQISAFYVVQTGQSAWFHYQPPSLNDFRLNGAGADRFILTDQGALTLPIPVSNVVNITAKAFAAGIAASFVDSTGAFALQITPATAAIINNVGGTSLILRGGGANGITIASTGQLTVANGGLAITAGGMTITAGGANITGTTTVLGAGTVVGVATGGDKGAGTVNAAAGYYLNGNLIGAGSVYAVKAADEPRTSTVVLTNDSTLIYAIPAAGTYEFEFIAFVTVGANGIGIDANVNFSGSFGAGSYINLGTLSTTDNGQNVSATVNNAQLALGIASNTAASPYMVMLKGSIVATGAGTLGFAYSQNISNATPTIVKAGSYMRVAKMA